MGPRGNQASAVSDTANARLTATTRDMMTITLATIIDKEKAKP
ncbi:MAG: hypothetical protein A49_07290 [Methyloceanibacter sp.]|nr:MAG: hypothetical protein A49_07290 [Methyloceanibacter sp.]